MTLPTSALLRAHLRHSGKKRLRRPPAQVWPGPIARDYARSLLVVPRLASSIAREHLRPVMEMIARHDSMGPRGESGSARLDQDDIGGAFGRMRIEYLRRMTTEEIAKRSRRAAEQVDHHVANQVERQVHTVIGVDVLTSREGFTDHLLSRFVRENVSLIKTIGPEYFDQLQSRVIEVVRSGGRAEQIAKEIEERTGVAESRAKLIAYDQVGKLNGQVTEKRQRDLGINRYRWRTSMDERVRDEHREREGQVFSWDDPPEDGHPGNAVRCRCRSEPVMDDLLG